MGLIEVALLGQAIGAKRCEKDCSGRGVCNYNLGECRCFHGYSGWSSQYSLSINKSPCTNNSIVLRPSKDWLLRTYD